MTSCIGFLISMFGTRMCGQTFLFIVIANCAIRGTVTVEDSYLFLVLSHPDGPLKRAIK